MLYQEGCALCIVPYQGACESTAFPGDVLHWLSWCLLGFSTVKLLAFHFTLFFPLEAKFSPHSRGGGNIYIYYL